MHEIDYYHGDEPELEAEQQAARHLYEDDHEDDWKYEE